MGRRRIRLLSDLAFLLFLSLQLCTDHLFDALIRMLAAELARLRRMMQAAGRQSVSNP